MATLFTHEGSNGAPPGRRGTGLIRRSDTTAPPFCTSPVWSSPRTSRPATTAAVASTCRGLRLAALALAALLRRALLVVDQYGDLGHRGQRALGLLEPVAVADLDAGASRTPGTAVAPRW